MQYLGHPIVADKMYGGRSLLRLSELQKLANSESDAKPREGDVLINRQALHAYRLEILHPVSRQPLLFQAPYPEDFQRTLNALRETLGEKR